MSKLTEVPKSQIGCKPTFSIKNDLLYQVVLISYGINGNDFWKCGDGPPVIMNTDE